MRIVRLVVSSLVGAAPLAALPSAPAPAEPLRREEVPAPLAPWVDWALHGAEDLACPFVHGDRELRQCAWPSRLRLVLRDEGGRFRQEWRVDRRAWVPLPGDARAWPQDVRVDDTPAVVVAREKVPVVELERGTHLVAGSFRWLEPPESLRIPPETGLVTLELRGRPIGFPDRDLAGRLWLQRRAEPGEEESRLEVAVHRRVVDEVPLQLETRVQLRVSGRSREVLLGGALPDRFTPMAVESPLPARVESDGRLRVQVRPGTWSLRLTARHEGGPVGAIVLPERDPDREGPWDDEEVWAFDARSHLRLVVVEGVPGIDPQQTELPDDWRHLPAYLMQAGSRMQLVEKRRGDEDPAPDRLGIERTWWLDFDGGGYTVHDEIDGTLSRSWRMEAAAPTRLGRVAIDGQDQFLSRIDGDERIGVEVRQGQVHMDADSRLEGVRSLLPAVGWSHDFQKVSGQLNLPPGWTLLHAWGVDDVRATWTTRWSLLEIFMVLVTAMIVAHLWGLAWGGVALATLMLIYPEPGAPRWSWLLLLAVQALLRVVPEGGLHRAMRLARLGAIAVLATTVIPFVVQQARLALYPALEFPYLAVRGEAAKDEGVVQAVTERAAQEELRALTGEAGRIASESLEDRPLAPARKALPHYYAPDPLALVSTGPGLPHWGWRAVRLSWRGPVERDQQIRLLLIPPWGSSFLAWIRVGLVAALVLCVLDLSGRARALLPGIRAASVVLVAGIAGALGPSSAAADIPPAEMLEELRARLTEPPACFPVCAESPRMQLDVTPRVLRARIEIDAGSATAVPLPGGIKHWAPETVFLDGVPAPGLAHRRDGTLWLSVPEGKHQVTLEGPLPERDTVQIPLPLRPHRVVVKVSGWTVQGIREGGQAEDSLQLTREEAATDGSRPTLEPQDLPPFVRLERTIGLGLSWQVQTRVVRLTPAGRALFVEVPLLAGESVTTEAVHVEGGRVRVRMPAGVSTARWTSVLDFAPDLLLRAHEEVAFTEVWRLDAAPLWHVEVSGIPTVHSPPAPIRIREWRPWPNEEVRLDIVRPGSIDGRTLTLDRTTLGVRPGLRASETTLGLALRASRGVQHAVVLPEGADLQSVSIDGELQPVRSVEGRVVLPIQPGKHLAELVWRSPEPIRALYRTPTVDVGAPSVNAEIELAVPADRWVLFVGGPRLGPAVLFWSLLIVALLVALGLGRLPLTPLGWGSWLLLFVGLTQVPVFLSLVVVGWLVALGWRRENARAASDAAFNGMQLVLVAWTAAALASLLWAIRQGLLGLPDMQIAGNGSSGLLLRWYQDRTDGPLPTAWMFSVPLGVYRLAMLAWALWLARALLGWVRWGWRCFSSDGIWRPLRRRRIVEGGQRG